MDAEGRTCRTGLYAGLIIVACTQVTLDCQLLANFTKGVKRLLNVERARSSHSICHRQQLFTSLLSCAFREEVAKALPQRTLFNFLCERYNRNVVIRTPLGTNATADTAFGDIHLTTGHACNTGATTEHTHGVLALTTGGSDADVAYDHPFAVHA